MFDEPAAENSIMAAEAAYSAPVAAPARHEQIGNVKDMQLIIELAELRGFKAATMAFLRSREKS